MTTETKRCETCNEVLDEADAEWMARVRARTDKPRRCIFCAFAAIMSSHEVDTSKSG